jgi:phosphoglycolate phosphatase
MQIENILFDLDGTLIDSIGGIQYSIESAIATILPDLEIPDLKMSIGPPIRELLKQVLTDVRPEILDEIVHRFREIYDRDGWKRSLLYEGVYSTLDRLHQLQVKQWIVTNKPILPTQQIIDRLNLQEFFTDVFSPDCRLPSFTSKADMVAALIANYGLNPRSTWLVGDSHDDALAASLAGIPFIAATYGYGRVHLTSDLPIADRLSQFSDLLNCGDATVSNLLNIRRLNQ